MCPLFRSLDELNRTQATNLYLARENLADSNPAIIPWYKVENIRFLTLYGMITMPLCTNYSCARYNTVAITGQVVLFVDTRQNMFDESNYVSCYWLRAITWPNQFVSPPGQIKARYSNYISVSFDQSFYRYFTILHILFVKEGHPFS